MIITRLQYWLWLVFLSVTTIGAAQSSAGGQPRGWADRLPLPAPTPLTPLAVDRLLAEDAIAPGERFAAALPTAFTPDNSGEWTQLPNGDRLWRLVLQVADAQGLAVFYDQVHLAPGSRLFCYHPTGEKILGAYTPTTLGSSTRFWTGFIPGATTVVEYQVPVGTPAHIPFRIWRVDHAYRPLAPARNLPVFEFGSSKPCHPNANCTLGDDWQNEQRALSRIIVVVEEGSGYCSGNLINNTAEDGTPYLLTGFHCQDGFTPLYDLWRFDFGYLAADCANPADEPHFVSLLGADFRAGRQQNDFLLLELFGLTGLSNPYFSGWDRQAAVPDTGVLVHHPRGDIMKIARGVGPITIYNPSIEWNNAVTTPASHHLRMPFSEGSFELGSSGAALYDENHRIVGQLHGGQTDETDCEGTTGYFGRLHLSWDGGGTATTRLRDWLDPLGTAPQTLGGLTTSLPIVVTTPTGVPVGDVRVTITLNGTMVMEDMPLGADPLVLNTAGVGDSLTVSLSKNDEAANGVSVFDQILTSKHLLDVTPFDDPYQLLAADVNRSQSISTFDVILMKKVAINIDDDFGAVPTWQFIPADATVDLTYTVTDTYTFVLTEEMLDAPLHFIGLKTGDVNYSATVE